MIIQDCYVSLVGSFFKAEETLLFRLSFTMVYSLPYGPAQSQNFAVTIGMLLCCESLITLIDLLGYLVSIRII